MSSVSVKFISNSDSILQDFVRNSYRDDALTDCTLLCRIEDRSTVATSTYSHQQHSKYHEFRCHRLVLSAYSDFFRLIFSNKNGHASCYLDIDSHTLDSILRLIYHGSVEILSGEREQFYNAASKLGLREFIISNPSELSLPFDSNMHHLKRRLTGPEESATTKFKSNAIEETLIESGTRVANSIGRDFLEKAQLTGFGGAMLKTGEVAGTAAIATSTIPQQPPAPSPVHSVPKDSFTCSICNKQYSYKISLNKHIKSAHPSHHPANL